MLFVVIQKDLVAHRTDANSIRLIKITKRSVYTRQHRTKDITKLVTKRANSPQNCYSVSTRITKSQTKSVKYDKNRQNGTDTVA